jgi:hypothetical protein
MWRQQMLNFLRGRNEQAKAEGRREAFEQIGTAIGEGLNLALDEYIKGRARDVAYKAYDTFKLRVAYNVFLAPSEGMAPQQGLKKEWDFFKDLLLAIGTQLKEEMGIHLAGHLEEARMLGVNHEQLYRAKMNVALLLLLDEVEDRGKQQLSEFLDQIHRNKAYTE